MAEKKFDLSKIIDEFDDVNDDIVVTEIPNTWHTFFCHCCY